MAQLTVLDLICVLLAIGGVAWGAYSRHELYKWGLLNKYGRIVVASKGKVRLNATIQEWALWCRAAEKDPDHQSSLGRTVYDLRGTQVAVVSKTFVPDSYFKQFTKWVAKQIPKRSSKPNLTAHGKGAVQGTWSAEDHTDLTSVKEVNG